MTVHLLYSSTGTGQATQSGQSLSLFKQPKLYAVIIIFLLCAGYFIYALSNFFSDDVDSGAKKMETSEVVEVIHSDNPFDKETTVVTEKVSSHNDSLASGDVSRNNSEKDSFNSSALALFFPLQNLKKVYVSGVVIERNENKEVSVDILFQLITDSGNYYIDTVVLNKLGVSYMMHDECLIQIEKNNVERMITCPPIRTSESKLVNNRKNELTKPSIALF